MKTTEKVTARWKLYSDNAEGKQVLAGKFLTDFAAVDYAKLYRLVNWRVVNPDGTTVERGHRDLSTS